MPNWATVLRSIWAWPAVIAATLVAGAAVIVAGARNPAAPAVEHIIQTWSRFCLRACHTSLEIEGRTDLPADQAYVVVSNHQSNLDIMVNFLAAPGPVRFLAKKELFRIPVLAQAMRAAGIVEVDRQAGVRSHDEVNREAVRVTELGLSLMVYPEGTRTRTGQMGSFKLGAFAIASELGLAVLPVAIHGTRAAWPSHSFWVHGGTVTARIGDPVPTDGIEHAALRSLARHTRAQIEADLADMERTALERSA